MTTTATDHATPDAADPNAEIKIVTFIIGGQSFAIPMSALIEIREWEAPTPLPGVPPYVKGVTNLRGTVLPVVGLAERMGWRPSEIHARSCILVVALGGRQAGFLIDEVGDIVVIRTGDIKPAPETSAGELAAIAGLVQVNARGAGGEAAEAVGRQGGGTMVSILDLEALSLTRSAELAA